MQPQPGRPRREFSVEVEKMRKHREGFTLLEIMIVVILISLLATLAGVNLVHRAENAKIRLATVAVKGTLASALETFYLDNSFYPTTAQGLHALVEKPAGAPEPVNYDEEGYLDDLPLDPWNMPFQYESPGRHKKRYDLWSMGPDRASGTDDDIGNWRDEE
jgi:general secretion pathway protein G